MSPLDLLRELPVSLNNFYGDPTLQWSDTITKLDELVATAHRGAVSIITKGKLSPKMCEQLADYQERGLRLVVLVSISELRDMENVGHEHRYENIRRLNAAGVPAVGYVRPLTPPYNTSSETIEYIFRCLGEVGCRAAMVAGFRGDDNLVGDMQPDQVAQWVLRVKQMTPQIWGCVKTAAQRHGVRVFTRTSCVVDFMLGNTVTYNPYYNSPNLAKCAEIGCPLQSTCLPPAQPREGSLQFLRSLGYQLEFQPGTPERQVCDVMPHNRLECKSCCTTCFKLNNPRLFVYGDVNLGDLTFIRFISGMIAMQPGCRDTGAEDIGHVRLPNYPDVKGIVCLNSWWAFASIGKKCFDCKYCIEKHYGGFGGEDKFNRGVGFAPSRLLEML